MKKAIYSLSVFALAFVLIGAGCGQDTKQEQPTPTTTKQQQDSTTNQPQDKKQDQSFTLEESEQIATKWIKTESPTYNHDGSKLELKGSSEIDQEGCEDCYQFMYEFESSHGGYGDRSDKMVTQVITPHEMTVTVENGSVVRAITDQKFDEMSGEMISSDNKGESEIMEPGESKENTTTATSTTSNKSIKLKNISDGDTISRTTTIKGKAKGPWYFEGSFSLIAKDSSGSEIDGFRAESQGDWMSSGYVPFEADLDLSDYSGNKAVLEFRKANPSGMKKNADSYTIQVNLN